MKSHVNGKKTKERERDDVIDLGTSTKRQSEREREREKEFSSRLDDLGGEKDEFVLPLSFDVRPETSLVCHEETTCNRRRRGSSPVGADCWFVDLFASPVVAVIEGEEEEGEFL